METERELIHLFEAVKRAADDAVADKDLEFSPAEKRCLDGLKQLQKFPVNYHLLVSTQVCVICTFIINIQIYRKFHCLLSSSALKSLAVPMSIISNII